MGRAARALRFAGLGIDLPKMFRGVDGEKEADHRSIGVVVVLSS
jgi:hypothetical protein